MPVVTGPITAGGNFPVVADIRISGGYRVVANVVARDAILTSGVDSTVANIGLRKQGMLVYTQATGQTWILGPGLTNADWSIYAPGGGGASYRTSFTNASLTLGVLTVVHSLGVRFNTLAVYDNSDGMVIPDGVTDVNLNTLTVDLTSYQLAGGGVLPGTWNVVVQS